MRRKDESRKMRILDFINNYIGQTATSPSVREISDGTGIPRATVQRYLVELNSTGEIVNTGNTIQTKAMLKMQPMNFLQVLGHVSCGSGDEEQEEVIEYIRMPESLVGKGATFALIAKGESMIDAGIYDGDYVIIRRTETAEIGDIVVALYDSLSNLKKLCFDDDQGRYYLQSCNEDKTRYADIYVTNLQIQGVAIGVYHRLDRI